MSLYRILIATHNIKEYAGSELVTLELASEFRQAGSEVHIAAFLSGEPMLSKFIERDFKILDLVDDIDSILSKHYDIVWMHHAPVYHHLCIANNVKAHKVIHSCLSPFEPFEAVPLGNERIDFILANSQETRQSIINTLGHDDERIMIFPNSVPMNFWGHARSTHSNSPRQIAIVSNHLAPELIQTAQNFQDNKISVTHFGLGGIYKLVTPELLNNFDVVITIGKTVQYCFALKIPVYCYDHFGGPGWLTNDNFNISAQLNFSGRGFTKKSSEVIAQEIIQGYDKSLNYLETLSTKAKKDFNLYTNLMNILGIQQIKSNKSPLKDSKIDIILHQHYYHLQSIKMMKSYDNNRNTLQMEIKRIKSTFSWHITKPLRLMANIPRHIKLFLSRFFKNF